MQCYKVQVFGFAYQTMVQMNTFARMESLCTLSAGLSFLIKGISLTMHSNLSLHLVSTWKLLSKLGGTGTLWRSLKCLHTEDVFCLWPSTRWCKCARVKPTYPASHWLHWKEYTTYCLQLPVFSHVFEGSMSGEVWFQANIIATFLL